MEDTKLWEKADSFSESHPNGSRCFFDLEGRWQESKIVGSAFVCNGELLVRVLGVVGGIPLDVVRFVSETSKVCPVCNGVGCFPEAVQAWDCGQEPPTCSFCSEGIISLDQFRSYIDQTKPETDGQSDKFWVWEPCNSPLCRTKQLVRVEVNHVGEVLCNECFSR